jgi:serine/threonine protein kinase
MTTERDALNRPTSPAGVRGAEDSKEWSVPGLVLLARKGSGGAGDVHEAIEVATGRHVAVKFLRNGGTTEESLRARLEREVQVAALLHHQNVVTIYYSGWTKGVPYLVMELVRGTTLMDHVRSRHLCRR